MEKEKNIGLMVLSTKANTSMVRRMVMDNFYGLIGRATVENLSIIIFTEKALTHGQMVEFTMVTGNRTKCTVKAYSLGLTDESTRESIMMIKSKDMEFSIGPMEGNMTDIGCPESKKGWAYISTQKARFATADGKTESASNGYKKRSIIWRCSNYKNREGCEQNKNFLTND